MNHRFLVCVGALTGAIIGFALVQKLGTESYRDMIAAWVALSGLGMANRELWLWRRRRLDDLQHSAANELLKAAHGVRAAFAYARSIQVHQEELSPSDHKGETDEDEPAVAFGYQQRAGQWLDPIPTSERYEMRTRALEESLAVFAAARTANEPVLGISLVIPESYLINLTKIFGDVVNQFVDPQSDDAGYSPFAIIDILVSQIDSKFTGEINVVISRIEEKLKPFLLTYKVR